MLEDIEPYQRKKGDPGLPGAGRPFGSKTTPKPLPPIHVDGMPYRVAKLKKGESVQEYWNSQSPKILHYMMKRMAAFIVYQEAGQPDPFGAEVFKILSKELVKEVRTKAIELRKVATSNKDEGKNIKAYRKKLSDLKDSLSTDVSFVDVPEETGNYDVLDSDFSPLGDVEDEF